MKQITYILIAFFLGGVLSLYFLGGGDTSVYKRENEKLRNEYKALQHQNDSISALIDDSRCIIDSLKKMDRKLDTVYIENKAKINKLKSKYEKTNRVDSFRSGDIIRYFTDSL